MDKKTTVVFQCKLINKIFPNVQSVKETTLETARNGLIL